MVDGMVRVRFAPSPTGPLHIGGARTALFNFLFARNLNGAFVLRIDDTDRERSRVEYERDIIDGLSWLGLHWDEGPDIGGPYGSYRQSERLERYREAAEELISLRCAYRDTEGSIRLRYPDTEIVVDDLVYGRCSFQALGLGPQPVLIRSDGVATYQLASVIDDIDMEITHIIRGQDHLTNSAKQVVMFQALTEKRPQFAHLPLILSREGGKLSKRSGELALVKDFSARGFLPEALVNFLVLLGWSHPNALEEISLPEAMKSFSLDRVNRTGAIFDDTKLLFLNGWWLRHLPVPELAERALPFAGEWGELLSSRGPKYCEEAIGELRDSMSLLTDIEHLGALLASETIDPEAASQMKSGDERARGELVVREWLGLLREFGPDDRDRYTKEQFLQLQSQLKKRTALSGKDLFQPLRLAVMGALSGPELKVLVPLIPRQLLILRAEAFRTTFPGAPRES